MTSIIPVMASMRRVALCLLFVPLCLNSGCTSGRRVTIPDWQNSVIKYVNDEGEGRPSILRDVTIHGGRRGFAVLGHSSPERAKEVVGLLLAHRSVAGRPTFIYLVAQVVRTEVRDIRLALLSEHDGRLRWHLGRENDDALHTYLTWRADRWRTLYPDRDDPPLSYEGFPVEEDAFDITVAGSEIAAVHAASSARWTIAVATTQPASVATAADRPLR